MEGSHSGRVHTLGKRARCQSLQEFESPPFRQSSITCRHRRRFIERCPDEQSDVGAGFVPLRVELRPGKPVSARASY